jgi:hypothetical protein
MNPSALSSLEDRLPLFSWDASAIIKEQRSAFLMDWHAIFGQAYESINNDCANAINENLFSGNNVANYTPVSAIKANLSHHLISANVRHGVAYINGHRFTNGDRIHVTTSKGGHYRGQIISITSMEIWITKDLPLKSNRAPSSIVPSSYPTIPASNKKRLYLSHLRQGKYTIIPT